MIGAGITIEGAIFKGKGAVRIDGTYIGNMDVDGNIVIGERGVVRGVVKSGKALIAGQVEGNIHCSDDVHFTATSIVIGDVASMSLVIDEGAQFNGRCTMTGGSTKASFTPDKPSYQEPLPDAPALPVAETPVPKELNKST